LGVSKLTFCSWCTDGIKETKQLLIEAIEEADQEIGDTYPREALAVFIDIMDIADSPPSFWRRFLKLAAFFWDSEL
jgi:hypothetical protein